MKYFLLIVCFLLAINNSHPVAFARNLKSNKYKISFSTTNLDNKSKFLQKKREEQYLLLRKQVYLLKKNLETTNPKSAQYKKLQSQIVELNAQIQKLSGFSDDKLYSSVIECFLENNNILGIKLLYKEDRFFNKITKASSAELFYKHKIFQKKNHEIWLQPSLLMSNESGSSLNPEIAISYAVSKTIKNVDFFTQVSAAGGKDNSLGGSYFHNYSILQCAKIKYGIMFSYFNKYDIKKNHNPIYNFTNYNQFSVAKEFKSDRVLGKDLTIQIGYFTEESLVDKRFNLSGTVFSIWMNI